MHWNETAGNTKCLWWTKWRCLCIEIDRMVQNVWSSLVNHGGNLQEEDYSEKTENEIFELIILSLQAGDIELEWSCSESDSYYEM